MITIKNDELQVSISLQGAELQSVLDLHTHHEYLWQAVEPNWKKKAPVLFPFVGALKEKKYRFNDVWYPMGQHGFARDFNFELVKENGISASFRLLANEQTKTIYPFDFVLEITYALEQRNVLVTYSVHNTTDEIMWFSIGAHPGFSMKFPCDLIFNQRENLISKILDPNEGIITDKETVVASVWTGSETVVRLTKESFDNGALIFEKLNSSSISLIPENGLHPITMEIKDTPYFGVWSDKGPFVCLEPWWGIADFYNATQDITQKTGIRNLEPKNSFSCSYNIIL